MTAIEISQKAARILYRAGNNAGAGYAPYADVDDTDDTIEAATAAARADGWELVYSSRTSDDLTVLRNGDDEWMAIGGDAKGHAPWAVTLTDVFPSARRLQALRSEAAEAGDADQVKMIDWAIGGDRGALLSCALVIAEGQG
jgi:hypothetical protein